MFDKTISVLGLGYIGLPTASLLGTKGYQVVGIDVNPAVVERINQGEIHIVEPDLDVLVKSAVLSGHLSAANEPVAADIHIIAVPTPLGDNNVPDLAYVEAATKSLLSVLKSGDLIILESTVPIGTTEHTVARIVAEAGFDTAKDIFVAHCPERVLPGQILRELVENDRIVGGLNPQSTQAAVAFYETFVRGEVLATNAATAEMAKLTENAFRDVNIAYANELSLICDRLDINVWELIRLANRHPRVNILNPGPGVGGHCIAVDPWFIVSSAPEVSPLIQTARQVNEHKPHWVVKKVEEKADRFKHPVIACLGLAFKANVDDLRESPALAITQELAKRKDWEVLVCEPNVEQLKEFDLLPMDEVIERADIVLVLVDHKEFLQLDAASLKEKIIIDTRGIIL